MVVIVFYGDASGYWRNAKLEGKPQERVQDQRRADSNINPSPRVTDQATFLLIIIRPRALPPCPSIKSPKYT